jgi:protein-S-isoprenylcysteine O-methyltransferase Ste14
MDANDIPRPCSRIMPPLWFLAALAVMVAVHFWLPILKVVPWPWNLLGTVPIVYGVAIAVIARQQFARRQTTIKPYAASAVLVTDGVFGWTRNPMYLGMSSVLVGAAVCFGSLTPLGSGPGISLLALWLFHPIRGARPHGPIRRPVRGVPESYPALGLVVRCS